MDGSDMMTMTYVLVVKPSMYAANMELRTSMLVKFDDTLLQLSLNCLIMLLIFSNRCASGWGCARFSQCDITCTENNVQSSYDNSNENVYNVYKTTNVTSYRKVSILRNCNKRKTMLLKYFRGANKQYKNVFSYEISTLSHNGDYKHAHICCKH